MIKALENNTLGLVLASLCGFLLLACLGLAVFWVMPPSVGGGDENVTEEAPSGTIVALKSALPMEEYSVISERPIFNEDRRPAPVILVDDDDDDDGPPVEDVGAPDVQLAGVIITPSLKMATLRSKEHEQSLVAFEGQPLEGDFGTWQVSRIDARRVTLASADGEELQLELQVHDAPIKEPPKPVAREPEAEVAEEGGEQPAEGAAESDEEALTRAEEIRQRIEERREQLRQAAESRDSDQASTYREAIQNMIQQGRREQQQAQQQAAESGAQDEG